MKKSIALLLTLTFVLFSSVLFAEATDTIFSRETIEQDGFKVDLTLKNPSNVLNDGIVEIDVLGNKAPYLYKWSLASASVYQNSVQGFVEGESFSVEIIDDNGKSTTIEKHFPAHFTEESINSNFKPVVDFVGAGIFWDPFAALGIYDPTVMVNERAFQSPFWEGEKNKDLVVKEWLVAKGDKVENYQKVAIIGEQGNDSRDFFLRAEGEGTFTPLVEAGAAVWYKKEKKFREGEKKKPAQLFKVDYGEAGYPLTNPNGSSKTADIPFIVVWLVLGAVFFTIRFKFINFRGALHAIHLVRGVYDDPNNKSGEVSHFQALTTALSATVGLGNIASVAIAISIGGAGATFWMILAGLLGMASKFTECTLGVKYREIDENGNVSGGPMYYLSEGLKKKNLALLGKILAFFFAILCIGASFGGGNMFQANQAYAQVAGTFGLEGYGLYFGILLAGLVGVVIIGGIKSIANVTDKIVPVMVGVYVLTAIIIIGMNFSMVDEAFSQIINGAFAPSAIKGGIIGVLIIGFQRAAFSNEAGVGSASIAHSAAKTQEPVSEGTVALLEPFIDTVIVCTMTSLVLIFTGFAADPGGMTGAELTSSAFSREIPWFKYVLSIAIFLFAFSTMISWSYYGLKAWTYIFGETKRSKFMYQGLFLIFVVVGATVGLGSVLVFSDMMILGMAFPNIIGLIILSGEVNVDMKDYYGRIKSGVIKRFK